LKSSYHRKKCVKFLNSKFKFCKRSLPESKPLPSAFYRALGKEDFAESRTRQSPALGKELVYWVRDTRHREALDKYCFVERQTLDKDGARQRAVSGRLQLTAVSRPSAFAEGRKPALGKADSLPSAKYMALGKECLCRVSSLDTRQSTFLFFLFWPPNFLW
jgi:hypothetical protein